MTSFDLFIKKMKFRIVCYYVVNNNIKMVKSIIQRLLEEKKSIQQVLTNSLTDNLAEQIILNSITSDEIKSVISENILTHIDKHPEKQWDWYYISMNPNITMETIERHPE